MEDLCEDSECIYPKEYGANPLFPNKGDFEVILKDDLSGMGVITYRNFWPGDIVCAITGEVIEDIRQHSLQINGHFHLHDTYFSGYFLHSCEPNIRLDMDNLLVYAVKDIYPGDDLLMDYAQTEDVLYRQFKCLCGSENCRGWIKGRKE